MFAIVLTDRKGVVHKVYTVPACSPQEHADLENCARHQDLHAIVLPVESSWSVADVCDDVVGMLDSITTEIQAYVSEDPVVEVVVPKSGMTPTFDLLELDWDEDAAVGAR